MEISTLVNIHVSETTEAVADAKEQQLFAVLASLPSVIVALSGGTDSAYLAWAAHRVLREKSLAITALSESYSAYDREQVELFLESAPVPHQFVETHELENPAYRANAADRCYYCKDELFSVLDDLAKQRNFAAVAYGVNADDTSDFRPGHRAAAEHQVLTPLLTAQLTKAEIRYLAKRAALPCWDRPASACLSSRLPYGTQVTPERLSLVERGEAALRALGFRQFRVRLHDKLARVEIARDEMPRATEPQMAAAIAQALKTAGFSYVALDLEGYRQGSLNEALRKAAGTSRG